MKASLPLRRVQFQGFSLFEMLVVVALIGIMVAIVLPNIGNQNAYNAARNRRNAQEITAVCASAQVAGVNFVVPGDLPATVRNVLVGGSPESGPFKGHRFNAMGLKEEDAMRAIDYLQIEGSSLRYQPGSM